MFQTQVSIVLCEGNPMTPTSDPSLPLLAALAAERRGLMRSVHAQLSWLAAIGAGLIGALAVAAGAATCESLLYHPVAGGLVLLAVGGLLALIAALTWSRALGLCAAVAELDAAAGAAQAVPALPTPASAATAPPLVIRPQAPRLRSAVRRATLAFLLVGLLLAAGGAAWFRYADALYDAQCTTSESQQTHRFIRSL
jgi:hypothetical protein